MCTVQVKKRDVSASVVQKGLWCGQSQGQTTLKTSTLWFTGSLPLSLSFLIWKMNLRPAWATHGDTILFYFAFLCWDKHCDKRQFWGGRFTLFRTRRSQLLRKEVKARTPAVQEFRTKNKQGGMNYTVPGLFPGWQLSAKGQYHPQPWPQANLVWEILQLRFSLPMWL